MSTPSIPGIDREALAYAIQLDLGLSRWEACRAADVALAHIADRHECSTLPATWDDGGARPVEGEHGWVTPLLPDGEGAQRFPDGTPVEVWHPEYSNGLLTLDYVAGIGYSNTFGGARYSASWREGTLIRPVLPPACDREHSDEWVEVNMGTLDGLPNGKRVRREWVLGAYDKFHLFVHRDDLPDGPRALIARELGPAKADTFLGLLDEHGWTVTRKEGR